MMVNRVEFDALLLGMCKDGGVRVIEDTRVRGIRRGVDALVLLSTKGEEYQTRLVIGADGANSLTARDGGLNPGWQPDQKAIIMTGRERHEHTVSPRNNGMYVFYGFAGSMGYGYLFPKGPFSDIGIGHLFSSLKKPDGSGLRKEYDRFIRYLARKGLLSSQANPSRIRAAMVPLGGPLPKTYSERLLLAGDAAGFVNAFTAEGIYYAMVSGDLAAQTAVLALREDDVGLGSLSRYQNAWRSEIGRELNESVRIQSGLFKNGSVIDFIVQAAGRNDRIRRLLTDYATGQLEPKAMKRALWFRFLPFYLKYRLLKWARP
jgi:flavin-dependent dehydrogenase